MTSLKQASPPLKRRSSEPHHHLRNKPSIVIDYYLRQQPTTTSNPRPIYRYSRKTFFYVILIALACTFIQHKLLGRHLPYEIVKVQFGTFASIVPSILQADHHLNTKACFFLQEPKYEITVLRSVLLHQNDTYRNAIPSKTGRDWFVQSLAWLSVKDGGIRPDHRSIAAFCEARDANAKDSFGIKADVNVVWTNPKDRGIGQDVMLLIECDAAPFLREDKVKTMTINTNDTQSGIAERHNIHNMAKQEMIAHLRDSLYLSFSFNLDIGKVETSSSGRVKLNFHFKSSNLALHIDELAQEHVKMTACLSPAFYDIDEKAEAGKGGVKRGRMPLLRRLEWREHMRHLGVERVNWYGRHESMKDFVDAYNELQQMKDTFRWAPPLGSGATYYTHPYHDQDAYLTDCILSNRDTSDHILVLDVDEYPMVNFDDESYTPAEQFVGFMESMPDDKGVWEMSRIPMSAGSNTALSDEKLLQDQMECTNEIDDKVKSFYKSKSVIARMYPIGREIAKKHGLKPDRPFAAQGWNSSVEEAWPKLLHYRSSQNSSSKLEVGCTSPSPLRDPSGYKRYREKLRLDVLALKEQIEQILR